MSNITRGIDHVGLTVPDLHAATRFFQAAFGAEILYDTLSESKPPQHGPDAEAMLGIAPGASVEAIRLLRLANGASIELFAAAKADRAGPLGIADIGLHHFALYCDDLEAALAQAIRAGATALRGPNALNGPEGGDGNRMNYIRTPWGMLIELITYPAGVTTDNPSGRWTPQA